MCRRWVRELRFRAATVYSRNGCVTIGGSNGYVFQWNALRIENKVEVSTCMKDGTSSKMGAFQLLQRKYYVFETSAILRVPFFSSFPPQCRSPFLLNPFHSISLIFEQTTHTKPDNTSVQTSLPACVHSSHPPNPPPPTSSPSSSAPRLTAPHTSRGTPRSAGASNPHSTRRTLAVTPATADFGGKVPRGEAAAQAARRHALWCVTTHSLPPFRNRRGESADRAPKPRGTSILEK